MPLVVSEIDGDTGVGILTLNRPEKRNALSKELLAEYVDELDKFRNRPEIKVVITRGAGKAFSAGMDLHHLREHSQNEALRDWGTDMMGSGFMEAVRLNAKIMIAEVHGHCLGAAFGLMMAHDLAVASEDCQIGMPEVMRGSFGRTVTAHLVHSGIPIKKVVQLQVTNEYISGDEAANLGLVNWAVPADELSAFALERARHIAQYEMGPLTNGKLAIQMDRDLTLPQALFNDHMVGMRQRLWLDPLDRVDEYLASQKGGSNTGYLRGSD